MSDDELLNLADQKESLGEFAREAVAGELRKRRLNVVAPAVAEAILGSAITSAQKIELEFWGKANKQGKFKDEHFQDIVAEFVYLFFNLCDRDAYVAIPDPQKRSIFLNSVFYHVLQIGKAQCMTTDHAIPAFTRREERPDPTILIVKEGMDNLNDRLKEYSGPLFAAPNAALAGTVFWEFGKHIVKFCEQYDQRPSLQLEAAHLACEAYKVLIPVFVKMHEPPRKSVGFFRRLFK
jgi:hypothetical protein